MDAVVAILHQTLKIQHRHLCNRENISIWSLKSLFSLFIPWEAFSPDNL